jgi:hypothetical protein
MALSNTYALAKVFNIRTYDIDTGEMNLSLKKLKETTFTNNSDTVWVTGGQAGTRLASFDMGKTATIAGASAVVSDELISIQTGTDVATLINSTLFRYEDVLTISSDVAITTYTATGTVGSEIEFAYILDANGDKIATLTQDAAATPTKFTYTPLTKTIAFASGAYTNGTKVRVIYNPTAASMKHMQSNSQTFAKTVKVEADCLLKDVCRDKYVYGQIQADKGKISGAFEWSLSDGGEATVHNFECEFLESCASEKLWDFYIVDPDDLT